MRQQHRISSSPVALGEFQRCLRIRDTTNTLLVKLPPSSLWSLKSWSQKISEAEFQRRDKSSRVFSPPKTTLTSKKISFNFNYTVTSSYNSKFKWQERLKVSLIATTKRAVAWQMLITVCKTSWDSPAHLIKSVSILKHIRNRIYLCSTTIRLCFWVTTRTIQIDKISCNSITLWCSTRSMIAKSCKIIGSENWEESNLMSQLRASHSPF